MLVGGSSALDRIVERIGRTKGWGAAARCPPAATMNVSTHLSESSSPTLSAVTADPVRDNAEMMMDALYAVGWRAPGRPRQWVWGVFPSLDGAVRVARGYAKLDGGGRWRVYSTRVVAASGSVREVRDQVLAEGVERPARRATRPDG